MLEKHRVKPSVRKSYNYPDIAIPQPKKRLTKRGRLCEKATEIL